MRDDAFFFCKEVCQVDISCHMLDMNIIVLNGFSYGVFSDLDVTKTFSSHVG